MPIIRLPHTECLVVGFLLTIVHRVQHHQFLDGEPATDVFRPAVCAQIVS